MREEKELHKDIQRGEKAEKLLKDPLIVEFFEEKRKTIVHNLATCKYWEKPEERDALLNMLRCLNDFEEEFSRHIRSGNKAKSLLKTLLDKAKGKK